MRKILVVISTLSLLFITPSAFAAEKQDSQKTIKLGSQEVVNKDYFAFGERVEISGTVNGDVYAAAGTVIVDGKINGDLLVAGGTVSIDGEITQDVRVAAGNVTISGKVGGSLTAGSGNIEITSSGTIGGSILAGGGNFNLNGSVGKNIKIGAGNARIDNTVGGEIEASVNSLTLGSKATISGSLTYWSEKDASIDTAARVNGEIVKKAPPKESTLPGLQILAVLEGIKNVLRVISFVSTLILGLLFLKFLPGFMATTAEKLNKRVLGSLGVGAVGLLVWPLFAVLLLVVVVTAPLGVMLLTAYGIALWIAKIFVINWLGTKVLQQATKNVNPYWAYVVGIMVFYLLGFIPVIGGITSLAGLLLGLGALLLTKKEIYQNARDKKII